MTGRTPVAVSRAMRDLGGHLLRWRQLNGVTQALLAERANVSIPTVRAIETGSSVSSENLLRVMRVLGVLDT